MAKTFETFIQGERERLAKEREDALSELKAAEDRVANIEWELARIYAYEHAPKPSKHPPTERKPRAPSTRAPRGDRGRLKAQILDLLEGARPDGLLPNQITAELGAEDTKTKQQVANLLSVMKKQGEIHQDAKRGPYTLPS